MNIQIPGTYNVLDGWMDVPDSLFKDCLQLLKMPKILELLVITYNFGLFYLFGELAFRSVKIR